MFLTNQIISTIVGVGVILILIGAYIGSYLLNKRTPKPKGCENLTEDCEGCSITTCSNNKTNKEENK